MFDVPSVLIPNPAVHGDYDNPVVQSVLGISRNALEAGASLLSVKLGRVTPKARPQVARFASAFNESLAPAPPPSTDWRTKGRPSIVRMYLNDRYGDCVIAEKYHKIGVWTGNDTPTCVTVADGEILGMYNLLKAGPGDSGCVVADVMDYWRSKGLTVNGVPHKIDGYVAVDWRNKLEVQIAIVLLGELTLAIDLPSEWASNPTTWSGPQTNIVGGHDIGVVDYNEQGVVIVTWGGTRLMPWPTFLALNNNTELYAALGKDWYNDDNLAPNGVDVTKLKAAIDILGGGGLPPLPEPTPPPIPPVPPAPPVPPVPPVPVKPPTYAGPVSIRIPILGTCVGTVGPLVPTAGGFAGTARPAAAAAGFSLWQVLGDVNAILAAYRSGDYLAAIQAVKKLLADLGVNLPFLPMARSAGPASFDAWQFLHDLGELLTAAADKDVVAGYTALKKVLADLGVNLPF